MSDDPVSNRLREVSWRRPLTEPEQAELSAWLAVHPEMQADWDTEPGLNQLLARLPDAPLASNFTARVLQAVEREEAQRKRARTQDWRWCWRVLVPRAAFVAVVATTCSFTYHRHLLRVEMAKSVAAVADARLLSNPAILEDFEAIRRLSQTPPPDTALLALLK